MILVFCPFTIAYLHGDFDLDLLLLFLLFDFELCSGPGDAL